MPTPLVAVTVVGTDRPGIVADVTGALEAVGGNLEDSTMTLLRGRFAMVLLVGTDAGVAQVQEALAPVGADGQLQVHVRAVDAADAGATPPPADHRSVYAVRVHGADRPGIVAAVTGVVARHGGNVVDLGTRLSGDLYVLMADVELPAAAESALRTDLAALAGRLGVDVRLDAVQDEVL